MAFGDIVQGPYTAADDAHPQATLGSAPTAGNLIVVVHVEITASSTPDSPLVEAVLYSPVEDPKDLAIYYRVVQGGDGQTYGATSGDNSHIVLMEIEGPFTATPLDVTAQGAWQNNPATQSSGTTASTGQASEFAVAAIADRDPGGSASGWTNSFVEQAEGVGTYTAVYVATKVLTATGPAGTTATIAGSLSRGNWGVIATFKASGGGGGAPEPGPVTPWTSTQEWRAGRTGPQQLAIPRFRGEFGQ